MTATFHVGDAIEVMSKLPEKSVDLILTSPPFLALRSYLPADHPDKGKEGGSQSTPGEFIDWLLDVVEACDRVLAPHGSLCVELGDTYSGSGGAGGDYAAEGLREGQPVFGGSGKLAQYSDARGNPDGTRDTTFSGGNTRTGGGTGWPLAKSLSLIPESFRFAMVYGFNPHTGRTTDPWRLRNVIRWVRPNPPVGALGDKFRPATSELMVFCKSAKRYFDLDAVREPYKFPDHPQIGKDATGKKAEGRGNWSTFPTRQENPAGAPPLDWWNIPLLEGEEETRYGPKERPITGGPGGAASKAGVVGLGVRLPVRKVTHEGAPPLDWWNIPPGGYEGAHYAVFPPELCVKPVKAMCPEKVCRQCGEPSRRIVGEAEYVKPDGRLHTFHGDGFDEDRELRRRVQQSGGDIPNRRIVTGFDNGNMVANRPTLGFSDCGHDDWRPGVVLDPFAGSGTTLAVATGHGRDAIGIDLDERNFELALQRVGPFILERAT